jgi:hypothetical protein
MKRFVECPDQALLNLWHIPDPDARLDEVYAFMTDHIYRQGYHDVTVAKVRRRIKQVLHRRRRIPRYPTLADYKRSRQLAPREGDLN